MLNEFLAEVGIAPDIITIILFFAGFALLIAECFNPGFGAAGILGIAVWIVDIFITADTLIGGFVMAALLSVILVILLCTAAFLASKGILPKKLVLKEAADAESGFTASRDMSALVGLGGVAMTDLRPAGIAIIDGNRCDVVSTGSFIESGRAVRVCDTDGNRIVVEEIK